MKQTSNDQAIADDDEELSSTITVRMNHPEEDMQPTVSSYHPMLTKIRAVCTPILDEQS
jgi:hypothetical protein